MSSENTVCSTQGHIGCLVVKLVAGSRSKPIVKELDRFLEKNGIEWTVSRLKAVWTAANHLRNGDRAKAQDCYRKASISYSKKTMLPKGNLSFLVKNYVAARRPSVIRRWAAALRFYTSLSLGNHTPPSPAQSRKALDAIQGESTCVVPPENMVRLVKEAIDRRTHVYGNLNYQSVEKHARNYSLHSSSYYYSDVVLPSKEAALLSNRPYGHCILSLMTQPWVPSTLWEDVPGPRFREQMMDAGLGTRSSFMYTQPTFIGRIWGIQEQSAKLRTVTQPSAALQCAFWPMHQYLDYACEHLYPKEACFHNQNIGAYAAMDLLQRGKPVFSVDLSSATDRFPRTYSLALLRYIGLGKYADALEETCELPLNADQFGLDSVMYEVGQPMGLYGSFPLFQLSNMTLAYTAELWTRSSGYEPVTFSDGSCFKVVGDDIILSDPKVTFMYEKALSKMGVTISDTKTFKGHIAEFAGFIVTNSTKNGYTAFKPLKVSESRFISNPLEFIHGLGILATNIQSFGGDWKLKYQAYRNTVGSRDISLEPLVTKQQLAFQRQAQRMPYVSSTANGICQMLLHPSSSSFARDEWVRRFTKFWHPVLHEPPEYRTFDGPSEYLGGVITHGDDEPSLGRDIYEPGIAVYVSKKPAPTSLREDRGHGRKEHQSTGGPNFWKDPLNAEFRHECQSIEDDEELTM